MGNSSFYGTFTSGSSMSSTTMCSASRSDEFCAKRITFAKKPCASYNIKHVNNGSDTAFDNGDAIDDLLCHLLQ